MSDIKRRDVTCSSRSLRVLAFLIFLYAVICPLAAASESPAKKSAGKPVISFNETTFDFGTVGQQEKYSHAFRFRNAGDQPLKIINVEGTWGCTAAAAAADEIPPGGESQINLTFATGKTLGDVVKQVTVTSNDPGNEKTTLSVSAHVQVDFGFEPDGIIFRNLRRCQSFEREVQIKGNKIDQIKLLKVESNNNHISGEIISRTENGKSRPFIRVHVQPGLPIGKVFETLTVTTDSPEHIHLPIKVFGEIIGNISVMPETVDFGVIDPDSEKAKMVTLTMGNPGDRFSVKDIQETTGFFNCRLITVKKGLQYQISMQTRPDTTENLINGRLVVHTDYPGEETININLLGSIRKKAPDHPQVKKNNWSPLLFEASPDQRDLSCQSAVYLRPRRNKNPFCRAALNPL